MFETLGRGFKKLTFHRFKQEYGRRWQQLGGKTGIERRFLRGTITLSFNRMIQGKRLPADDKILLNGELYDTRGNRQRN